MLRAFFRIVLAMGGAAAAAFFVSILEAHSVASSIAEGGATPPSAFQVMLADLGLLFPVAFGVGGALGVASLILEPDGPKTPLKHFDAFRNGSAMERVRAATAAPLLVVAIFVWCLASAHAARSALASGRPAEAGLTIGLAAVALLVVTATGAMALVPLLRRIIAAGATSLPLLADPLVTGGAALFFVVCLFFIGVAVGDTGGNGGALAIFGVLKRAELDLRPVANLVILAIGAYAGPVTFGRTPPVPMRIRQLGPQPLPPTMLISGTSGMAVLMFVGMLCARDATGLADPDLAEVNHGVEKFAPLGKLSIAAMRKATDRDKDGYSSQFGGGDCNDADPKINPGALDIPGNKIDEDCSGADTPAPVAPIASPKLVAKNGSRLKHSYNVVLFTVDTLRVDLGFMGYERPVSPNLDKLAAKATVFERAYSMASYTGKSVGPFLIGRYPSETFRDFGHFNTYFPQNVFVAERVKEQGARTFAGMCHWYFRYPTGLNQGMDVWDTSAIPPGMGDNDTSITSERLGDLAIKLLSNPQNTSLTVDGDGTTAKGRFFGWFHFFDPHAQYVPHSDAPEFKGGPYPSKNLYDGEVWFTDKHIGRVIDFIESQPWGKDTAIILTADHGEAFADHNMSWHGSEIWESLIRIPMVVYVPGLKPRRISVKRSDIDLVPTIIELMGVPSPKDESLRGQSLLDDLLLPPGQEPEERDVYVDMPQGPYNGVRRAIITGPTPGMKLIHSGGRAYQLYDLAKDPAESKDLSGNKEVFDPVLERMQAMRARLKEIEVKPQ